MRASANQGNHKIFNRKPVQHSINTPNPIINWETKSKIANCTTEKNQQFMSQGQIQETKVSVPHSLSAKKPIITVKENYNKITSWQTLSLTAHPQICSQVAVHAFTRKCSRISKEDISSSQKSEPCRCISHIIIIPKTAIEGSRNRRPRRLLASSEQRIDEVDDEAEVCGQSICDLRKMTVQILIDLL